MKSRHETERAMGTFQVVHTDGSGWRQHHGNLGQPSKDKRQEQEELGQMTAAYFWYLTEMDLGNT